MAGYLLQSKADSTVKKYKLGFEQFEKYCVSNELVSKPASPIVVAMYITSLLDEGKSESIILSAIYGIKWAHNVNDLNDRTESNTVKLSMKRLNESLLSPRLRKTLLQLKFYKLCVKPTKIVKTS